MVDDDDVYRKTATRKTSEQIDATKVVVVCNEMSGKCRKMRGPGRARFQSQL
jgi:hypothetical protein